MVNQLDKLYEQRRELVKQLHLLDLQIDEEMRIYTQKRQAKYKQCFLKDIELFNSKEEIESKIKIGSALKTPHYYISFSQDRSFWQAEITDLHKSEFIVSVSLYKEKIKTVKQALNDIADTIYEYEFENDFNGVG